MSTQLLDAPVADIEVGTIEVIEPKSDDRVVVLVHTGHQNPKFSGLELVYRWRGPEALAVGDLVELPPMPKMGVHQGIVTSLDGASHPYKGPVKFIVRKVS